MTYFVLGTCRNSPMHCEGDAIRPIDFTKWKADRNEKNIPSTKILDAIKRARTDISRLRSHEMDLWKDRKSTLSAANYLLWLDASFGKGGLLFKAEAHSQYEIQKYHFYCNAQDVKADPHSPVGTAFGFNKPKPQALEIANTSFLLQFATARFLNGIIGLRYKKSSGDKNSIIPAKYIIDMFNYCDKK